MSTIHFIGGEKGGVGKSVVARLCAQYCIDRSLPFVAVDADASHGALLRFYAEYTRPADLAQSETVDPIFTLATEQPRVLVDLPAQSDRSIAAWIAEAGILELAAESGVRLVFWHVIDDGKDAVITLERLLARSGAAAKYGIVKNMGRGKDFSLFEPSAARAAASQLGAAVIEIPELQAASMQKIDRMDTSFWAALHASTPGSELPTRIDRQRVKVWLQAAYDQIAKLGELF